MERQILFRGKTSKGDWVFGDLIQDLSDWYAILPIECEKISLDSCIEVIPETIGQFTGMTDNNGVNIFEGDKVKVDYISDRIRTIEFIDGSFKIVLRLRTIVTYPIEEHKNDIEVVGNIYEKKN
jgi:YopX protein